LLEISKSDPHNFLRSEINLRKKNKLPPFYRLISFIISGKNEQNILQSALLIKRQIPKFDNVEIMGPVNAPIFKLKKNFRSRILIRSPKDFFIQKYLASFITKLQLLKGIKLAVDVDPINFS
jgi:primosomal protein N' (replication factor Y)